MLERDRVKAAYLKLLDPPVPKVKKLSFLFCWRGRFQPIAHRSIRLWWKARFWTLRFPWLTWRWQGRFRRRVVSSSDRSVTPISMNDCPPECRDENRIHQSRQIVKKLCDGDAMLNSDDLNQKQGGEIDHSLPGFCFWRNESFGSI